MKSLLRRHRPSPAMIVALIALFVAMGGVSYGFATGTIDSREIKNNDVRSRDIRNNEIRTRDLRNNEIRGLDIRNSTIQSRDIALNAVTGADVKEDTLQKVPSAAAADSATTAGTADNVKTVKTIQRTALTENAPAATLATHGPFTLRAQCVPNATSTQSQITLQTTEDGSAARSEDGPFPVLDAGDGAQSIAFVMDAAGGPRAIDLRNLAAVAPSGKSFTGQIAIITDAATDSCVFAGHLVLVG